MTDPSDPDAWHAPGPDGSTPLDPSDAEGLKPTWVTTRAELNTAEQDNILAARRRQRWRRPKTDQLLTDDAVRRLHRDMFGDVWTWAGSYRRYETDVGVDPVQIAVSVHALLGDVGVWFDGPRPMTPDEAGCTFHHRLVKIHPFPNGNGRHTRLMTDLLLRSWGEPPFTWGDTDLNLPGETRSTYLAALRAADDGDYAQLQTFVRS